MFGNEPIKTNRAENKKDSIILTINTNGSWSKPTGKITSF